MKKLYRVCLTSGDHMYITQIEYKILRTVLIPNHFPTFEYPKFVEITDKDEDMFLVRVDNIESVDQVTGEEFDY